MHKELVKTHNENQRQRIKQNAEVADKLADTIKSERLKSDSRSATPAILVEFVRALNDPRQDEDGKKYRSVRRKFEKDDYRLYGIKVGNGDGTKVVFKNKVGRVVKAYRNGDGFHEFKVIFDGRGRKEKGATAIFDTDEVLDMAKEDDTVVGLEEDKKRLELAICAILCIAYVHVYKLVQEDPQIKRKFETVELDDVDIAWNMRVRKYAWETVEKAKAVETVNSYELGLIDSDPGLIDELKGGNSLSKLLRLDRCEIISNKGLMFLEREFNEKHDPTVSHYVRGAQASCRLGRVISLESCMAPLSAGGDRDELPPGVEITYLEATKKTVFLIKAEDVGAFGLGVRAILARAQCSKGVYQWHTYVPLPIGAFQPTSGDWKKSRLYQPSDREHF